MKNLEQIRAANALEAAPTIEGGREGGRNVAKKVPNYVRNNGLLGAAAFARETGKGYECVLNALIKHLGHNQVGLTETGNIDEFIRELGKADSSHLRRVTSEAMAYLNYLRRFAE